MKSNHLIGLVAAAWLIPTPAQAGITITFQRPNLALGMDDPFLSLEHFAHVTGAKMTNKVTWRVVDGGGTCTSDTQGFNWKYLPPVGGVPEDTTVTLCVSSNENAGVEKEIEVAVAARPAKGAKIAKKNTAGSAAAPAAQEGSSTAAASAAKVHFSDPVASVAMVGSSMAKIPDAKSAAAVKPLLKAPETVSAAAGQGAGLKDSKQSNVTPAASLQKVLPFQSILWRGIDLAPASKGHYLVLCPDNAVEFTWGGAAGTKATQRTLTSSFPGGLATNERIDRDSILVKPDRFLNRYLVTLQLPSVTAGAAAASMERHFQIIRLRGLHVLTGNHLVEPAVAVDGKAKDARLKAPFAMTRRKPTADTTQLVVTESSSHALRILTTVSPNRAAVGEMATLCGVAAEPGHVNGTLAQARFNQPGHLASLPGGKDLIVSDSGNHAIRLVTSDSVKTLAGSLALEPGHQDGPGAQARFKNPQGICADLQGNVYVADQGNYVLRRIAPDGTTTTLAGHPGNLGLKDGVRGDAQFLNMRGLTYAHGALYLLDGTRLRMINPATGKVTTLFGKGMEKGFKAAITCAQTTSAGQENLQPCMKEPIAIGAYGAYLFITDRGNNCVFQVDPVRMDWKVLVGDPASEPLREGMLRDGMPEQDGTMAAVPAPTALAIATEELYVGTENTVSVMPVLPFSHMAWPELKLTVGEAPARAGVDHLVHFTLSHAPSQLPEATKAAAAAAAAPLPLHMTFTVKYVNADGSTEGTCHSGVLSAGKLEPALGRFTKPGKGKVIVEGRTYQGIAVRAEAAVNVL